MLRAVHTQDQQKVFRGKRWNARAAHRNTFEAIRKRTEIERESIIPVRKCPMELDTGSALTTKNLMRPRVHLKRSTRGCELEERAIPFRKQNLPRRRCVLFPDKNVQIAGLPQRKITVHLHC